jgi:hypothetical protein
MSFNIETVSEHVLRQCYMDNFFDPKFCKCPYSQAQLAICCIWPLIFLLIWGPGTSKGHVDVVVFYRMSSDMQKR